MAVVTGQIKSDLSLQQIKSLFGVNNPFTAPLNPKANFANGTTVDKINLLYQNTISFTASQTQSLDLKALTDPLGGVVNLVKVKGIAVRCKSTTDGASITLAPNATNGWTSLIGTGSTLKVLASSASNDAWFMVVAPNTTAYAVGAANKVLDLISSAHAFDVDIVIIGTDA